MTANTPCHEQSRMVIQNFDLLAEAPGGVPKLRELILQLAVRGKLVPQDPRDEPAAVFLSRLRCKTKKILMQPNAGLIRADKPQGSAKLPIGWTWSCLEDLGNIRGGGTPSMSNPFYWNGQIPWVSPKDMKAAIVTSSELTITERATKETAAHLIPSGSVLIVGRSGILRRMLPVALTAMDCAVNQDLKAIVPFEPSMARYIQLMLKGHENIILRDLAKKGVTVESLKYDEFLTHLFPLPPLPEQKRIVARVDELMKRCDELEARQNEREEKHITLVSSCLHALTAPARRDARPPSDDRSRGLEGERPREPSLIIHPSTFNLLFTSPQSVAELRKTILQLAVQGRLVPQDPRDTPPTANFQGIKSVPPEVHLPSSWIVCRYRHLTSLVTSGSRGWKEHYAATGALFIRAQNIKTDALDLRNPAFVLLPERVEGTRSQVKQWDILVTITGSNVTKTALVTEAIDEAYVSQHIALTRPIWSEMAPWLHLCFLSPASVRGELEALAYGAKPGLNLSNIRDLMIPVPPLPEQNRIVAKVNELMALCDTLETKLIQSREDADRFAAAVVNRIDGRTVKLHSKIQSVF